jgi:hypothetical protein
MMMMCVTLCVCVCDTVCVCMCVCVCVCCVFVFGFVCLGFWPAKIFSKAKISPQDSPQTLSLKMCPESDI